MKLKKTLCFILIFCCFQSASILAEEEHGEHHDSHGKQIEIGKDAQMISQIAIDTVSPQAIKKTIEVYGKLIPQEDKVAHIHPRFSGILKDINKGVGQIVQRGEVLAIVESNQGLQPYEVRSQLEGRIVSRHGSLGEFVSDQTELYFIADLSTLWAEFQIYRDNFDQVAIEQKIKIIVDQEKEPILAKVSYISPITDEATQSKVIRAMIPNSQNKLRPGLFISAQLTVAETQVKHAVKRLALQTLDGSDVVFLNEGDIFKVSPIKIGIMDHEFAEILSGVSTGQKYVSENSFIIKAEIEKSGADHEH